LTPITNQTSPKKIRGAWDVRADGTGDDHLIALIDSVLSRVRALKDRLAAVCAEADTKCLLRVVQHVADGDQANPGFVLSAEDVSLLAELNAFLAA
jgi:hypothetical protein